MFDYPLNFPPTYNTQTSATNKNTTLTRLRKNNTHRPPKKHNFNPSLEKTSHRPPKKGITWTSTVVCVMFFPQKTPRQGVELMLVLSLSWCFFMGVTAQLPWVGVGMELAALIAGVALATFPYSAEFNGGGVWFCFWRGEQMVGKNQGRDRFWVLLFFFWGGEGKGNKQQKISLSMTL